MKNPLASKVTAAPAGRTQVPSGQRILLLDDEPDLVEIGVWELHQAGYQVTGFSDPSAALAHLGAAPQAFDLVLTDQSMPTMAGEAFAAAVHRLRGDLPVMLVTGNEAAMVDLVGKHGIVLCLSKPLTAEKLAEAARTCQQWPLPRAG